MPDNEARLLKNQIERDAVRPRILVTAHKVGYRLVGAEISSEDAKSRAGASRR
jgi:hypothetical protein